MRSDAAPIADRNSLRRTLVFGVCFLVTGGCGSQTPFEVVPVSGSVQYSDGTPLAAPRIELVFIPAIESVAEDGTGPRSARAHVDGQTGLFDSATTWKSGDGAIAGKHKVLVIARDQKGIRHPAVASKYADHSQTPLTVEVTSENMPLKILVEREPKGKR